MHTIAARVAAVAAVAAVGLAGLSACSEEEEPAATPTSSSAPPSSETPETTADPGPVEPTLPAAAEEDTKAGAEAFVEYYWAVVNYSQRTGDTTTLSNLHTASCEACIGGIDWIDEVTHGGGAIVGGENEVARSEAVRTQGGLWLVQVSVQTEAAQIEGGTVDKGKTYPKVRERFEFNLRYSGAAWAITYWREV